MTERPILFSAPMVQAILAGQKTQTRRVIRLRHDADVVVVDGRVWKPARVDYSGYVDCPYGQPGDRLWVRETWAQARAARHDQPLRDVIAYAADRESMADLFGIPDRRWRPSIHMPRWASRITLEVTGVRVERLRDITPADAMAEGVTVPSWDGTTEALIYVEAYRDLWEQIHGAGAWRANPWVWVVEFRRIEPCKP